MSVLKPCVPLEDEPKWVMRKPNMDGMAGNTCRAVVDDAGLRAAFSEANSVFVNLWQVYIRGPGAYSQVCRVVHEFGGKADESGHFMLSCTHEMGSKKSFTGGYFVDTNDIKGSKAQGRQTIINKVLYSGWAEHVDTALYLTHYAHSVYPYRRAGSGPLKQKLPKFSPDFVVMDFLVGRDGTWFFSNCLVLRSHRNPKGASITTDRGEAAHFGPNVTCTFMENNFVAVKHAVAADMTRRFGAEARVEATASRRSLTKQHSKGSCAGLKDGGLLVDCRAFCFLIQNRTPLIE